MFNKLMLNLLEILNSDPDRLMELAFVEVQNELVSLRADVARNIAKEKIVEWMIHENSDNYASDKKIAVQQPDLDPGTLTERKEKNALYREVLNEAEIQSQTLYVLKQWAIPIVLLVDPSAAKKVSREYLEVTQSAVSALEQYRNLDNRRTAHDTTELTHQLLGIQESTRQLLKMLIERMRNATPPLADPASRLAAKEKLIELKESLESRLESWSKQADTWHARAGMAMQQNNNELAHQAVARQKQYDDGTASIRALLNVLGEVLGPNAT